MNTEGNISLGSKMDIWESELEPYCDIDVWNKYFFPRWPNEMYQWYHDFEGNGKSDPIKGMHDVMQHALKRALEVGNIELY